MSTKKISPILAVAKDEWRYWIRSKLALTVLIGGLMLTLSSAIITAFNMVEINHQRESLQKRKFPNQ